MKHVATLSASLIIGVMSITNSAFAEIPNSPSPNMVDVSQWKKIEIPTCYENGTSALLQLYMYENKPFHRMLSRYTIGDQLIYQHDYAEYVGENGFTFETFHVKSKMAWTRYEAAEAKKAHMAVDVIKKTKLPGESTAVLCN